MIQTFSSSYFQMIGSGMYAESLPFTPGFGVKQIAWASHAAFIGGVFAPICYIGGPTVIRVFWCCAGIFGGLTAIAMCSPSKIFLDWAAPISMLFGVVFSSTVTSLFLNPSNAVGTAIYFISLYGGLALYSALLLYDTQLLVEAAENESTEDDDPINNSMEVFMDILNIFIKVFEIFASQGFAD
jgi:growth hormone-inducible transmembrane protein